MTQDYESMINYIQKNSKYVARIIYKDAEPVPIGIVVPRYADQEQEAVEEADQWFDDNLPLELWPASWTNPDDELR